MWNMKLFFLVTLWCSAFESVHPTLNLFNALKTSAQKTRCKLHEIGSNIIHHEHRHGDPCEVADQVPDQHSDNRIDTYDKLPITEKLQPDHGNGDTLGQYNNQPQYLNGHSYGPRSENPTEQANWSQYRPDRDHRGSGGNHYEPIATFGHHEPNPLGPEFPPDHHRQHIEGFAGQNAGAFGQGYGNGNFGQNINPWQSGSGSYGNRGTIDQNADNFGQGSSNGHFGQNVQPFGQGSYGNTGSVQVNTKPSIHDTDGTSGGFSGQESGISFERTTEKKNIDNIEDNLIFKSEPDVTSTSAEDITIHSKATTEEYPTSLDIDVRMARPGTTTTKSSTTTNTFVPVPTGGGRNLGKAPCKDGKLDTADGCMEAI